MYDGIFFVQPDSICDHVVFTLDCAVLCIFLIKRGNGESLKEFTKDK